MQRTVSKITNGTKAGRRWDCGKGKVMTVCTDTRSKVKGTVHSTPYHTLRSIAKVSNTVHLCWVWGPGIAVL